MGRVTDTISGSLATFRTPYKQTIRHLKAYFTPKQEGTGDPSPDNVRPITGWTGCEIWRTGKNLIDEGFLADANNYPNQGSNGYVYTNDIYLKPNTRYRFVWYDYDNTALSELEADSINLYVSGASEYVINNADYRQYSSGFMSPSTGIIRFGIYHPSRLQRQDVLDAIFNNGKLLLQVGTSDEDYEPYNGTTLPIDWSSAGTVYGGYVDLVTGEVYATYRSVDLSTLSFELNSGRFLSRTGLSSAPAKNNSQLEVPNLYADIYKPAKWYQGVVSTDYTAGVYNQQLMIGNPDYTTVADFKAAMAGKQFIYELATPTLVTTLTPTALRTLIGTNNIWSTANGNVTAEYFTR